MKLVEMFAEGMMFAFGTAAAVIIMAKLGIILVHVP
jgi:hypothetical protein